MTLGPLRVAALVAAVLATVCPNARADDDADISTPGSHVRYHLEPEVHLLFGYEKPFAQNGSSFGAGARVTFNIADGFIPGINDSVGVGVAFDFDVTNNLLVPVVLQWNFWLTPWWSVFAEPGIALGQTNASLLAVPIIDLGARLHITERLALTLRVGYPDTTLGLSFLL